MICPICGTQQRAADRCVQCHTPISEEKYKEEKEEVEESLPDVDHSLEDSFTTMPTASTSILGGSGKPPGPRAALGPRPTHETYPSISSQGSQRGQSSDAAKPLMQKRPKPILVATTQRVEGKRIGKYLGLVHANVVVDLSDLSISPTGDEYQVQFKGGTMDALKVLKADAAGLGANAVVAASFGFHRIDTQIILVSAVGTAVVLEGPKEA